ncbi:MAG: sulfite exporter TauE/SafE family protein [Actinomycetes bacterium]
MTTTTTTRSARVCTVPISGMTCTACEKRVVKALVKLPGVSSARANAQRGTATLLGPRLPDRATIDAAIRSAGYEPGVARWLSPDRQVWKTVVVAAVALAALAGLAGAVGLGDFTSKLADPSSGGMLLVFTLGLTAGVSTCMAMVGGLVLGFSASHAAKLAAVGKTAPSFITRMRPQFAFNVGRIVGFGILGAALGALGSSLSLPTNVTAILILSVAVVMFLLGIRLTGVSPRMAAWSPKLPAGLSRVLGINGSAEASYSDTRTALIGTATFFLPCGFTQAVQVFALSTASPVTAGLVMATFALGTTPGLLALASVPEITTGKRQVSVLRVVGVVVLAFALINVSSGLRLLGVTFGSAAVAAGSKPSSNVTISGGVETVTMTQVATGYEPADTVVYAGMPIKWVIDGQGSNSCAASIRVPKLGMAGLLKHGINTVDVPALPVGTVPFTCSMGMYSGSLIAIAAPATMPSSAPTGPAGSAEGVGTGSAATQDRN